MECSEKNQIKPSDTGPKSVSTEISAIQYKDLLGYKNYFDLVKMQAIFTKATLSKSC